MIHRGYIVLFLSVQFVSQYLPFNNFNGLQRNKLKELFYTFSSYETLIIFYQQLVSVTSLNFPHEHLISIAVPIPVGLKQ